jgi:hypothetical protein
VGKEAASRLINLVCDREALGRNMGFLLTPLTMPLLARLGPPAKSALLPLLGDKRTTKASNPNVPIYEYTAFSNGPDRHVAELTLLSVVDAQATTLCYQRER